MHAAGASRNSAPSHPKELDDMYSNMKMKVLKPMDISEEEKQLRLLMSLRHDPKRYEEERDKLHRMYGHAGSQGSSAPDITEKPCIQSRGRNGG